jgi:mannose-1-phosphate guanylyltransferase/mannose-6-phosphate isomerase
VAFFPSDHYVSDVEAFMAHVEQAFEATRQRPDLVTLLGITPERAEPGYGWIQAGEPLTGVQPAGLRWVRRFSEKPALSERIRLPSHGWLWNSFVMVGQVSTFLDLIM